MELSVGVMGKAVSCPQVTGPDAGSWESSCPRKRPQETLPGRSSSHRKGRSVPLGLVPILFSRWKRQILVLKSIQEIWGTPGEPGSSPAFPVILKRAPD